jgi:hypothetical protein
MCRKRTDPACLVVCLWLILPASCGSEEGFEPFPEGGFFDAPDGMIDVGLETTGTEGLSTSEPRAQVPDAYDDTTIEPVGELPADAPPEVEPTPCTVDLRGCREEFEGTQTVEFCPPPRNVCGRDNVNACCPPGYAPVRCIDCGTGENHGVSRIYDAEGNWVGCNGWEGENNYGGECARVICERENSAANEICDNNVDDDGDGLVDCMDRSDCRSHPSCIDW